MSLLWLARSVVSSHASFSASRRVLATVAGAKYDFLLVDVNNGVATITLKDDKKRNALSSGMMAELRDTIGSFEENKAVKAVVIRNDGKVFSSGHDLRELHTTQNVKGTTEPIFQLCSSLMLKIRNARFPVIAEVAGLATAGGCQLVAQCDLAIASENSTFATPGVNIGLFCTTPGVALGRAVPAKAAMHMLLTAQQMTAPEALRMGLLSQVVPADKLRETGRAVAEGIARAPAETVAIGKKAFYQQMSMPSLADAYSFGQRVMADNMGRPDAKEGIDAFIGKREPQWVS